MYQSNRDVISVFSMGAKILTDFLGRGGEKYEKNVCKNTTNPYLSKSGGGGQMPPPLPPPPPNDGPAVK